MRITVNVNGAERSAEVEPRLLLAHFLRDELRLTGTHLGCDTSGCGACTVLVDGVPIKSCTYLAVQADGRSVETVEGLISNGQLHPVQEAFKQEHGLHEHRAGRAGRGRCAERELETMSETHTPIHGLGHSMRRREDDRFIRGKGTYVDDVQLPGMLHMAILRSPLAHARITGVHTEQATALPGVVAVVTGRDLEAHNLAWMPTLSADTQAVLAVHKVVFQGQEVAAVVAEDPYTAHDALELIDVDYDPLPPVVDPHRALQPDAPLIREDKPDQTSNHIFHWEQGNREATERAFKQADRVVGLDTFYPRCHPAPLETCGCVADLNPGTGKATIWMTSQAP